MAHRTDRDTRPVRLARRDAGDRPRRTTTPRRATAIHRLGRQPAHSVHHEHQTRTARRPRTPHRRRARCEDRIRNMKDTGLRNLPLHDFSQNQIWIAVVMLATELTAWMQMLALVGDDARVWEPKRLRLRLFSIAGSIAYHSRRTWPRTHHTSTSSPPA